MADTSSLGKDGRADDITLIVEGGRALCQWKMRREHCGRKPKLIRKFSSFST